MRLSRFARYSKPKIFFSGVLLGLCVCSLAGFIISQKASFNNFERFFNAISPETQYFPTPNELLMTAVRAIGRHKILVLIGGSSIFRGTGQNSHELWSNELQRFLGDKFKVLNFADDGASFASFAGAAFRILIERYPKVIFVSVTSTPIPFDPGLADGKEPYNYLFWDAYYKKLFHPDKEEKDTIHRVRKEEIKTTKGIEMHLLSYLDSWFYFTNLWNWVGYNYIFTVWNDLTYTSPFQARRFSTDNPYNFEQLLREIKNDKNYHQRFLAVEKQFAKAFPLFVDFSKDRLKKNIWVGTHRRFEEMYTPRYRSKILCVFSSMNPEYVSSLPKNSKRAYKIIEDQFYSLVASLGYHALNVEDIPASGYEDYKHLLASGGKKIAAEIAPQVRQIAIEDGYYNK